MGRKMMVGVVYAFTERLQVGSKQHEYIELVKVGKEWCRVESYLRHVQGQEVVRLLFRLRTGSAGLLEDKKRCKMFIDEVCNVLEWCRRRCGAFIGDMGNLRGIDGYCQMRWAELSGLESGWRNMEERQDEYDGIDGKRCGGNKWDWNGWMYWIG